MLSFSVSAFQLFGACATAVPAVPPDLVGRIEYAIQFMPWPLVLFIAAFVTGGIGVAYVAEPKTATPLVVTCACRRRQATLSFNGEADSARFVATLTAACPWCQADAESKRSVGERIIHRRKMAYASANRKSEIGNRQSSRSDK